MGVEIIGGGRKASRNSGVSYESDSGGGTPKFGVTYNSDEIAKTKAELELSAAQSHSLRENTPMKRAEANLYEKSKSYQQKQANLAAELGLPPGSSPAQIQRAVEAFRIKTYVTGMKARMATQQELLFGGYGEQPTAPQTPGVEGPPAQSNVPYSPFRDFYSDDSSNMTGVIRESQGSQPKSECGPGGCGSWDPENPRVNYPVHGMSSDSVGSPDDIDAVLQRQIPGYDPNVGYFRRATRAMHEMARDEARAKNEMHNDFGIVGKYLEDNTAAGNEYYRKKQAQAQQNINAQAAMAQNAQGAGQPKGKTPKKESK